MNPQAATLRLAVFPRSGLLTDVLLVVAGARVALAAQIEIPLSFTPVPISGQTSLRCCSWARRSARLGASSLLLYFAVGLLGAPVYSGGDGGWEIVKGATGGYLIGFIVAALLTGWLARRRWDRRFNSPSPRCSRAVSSSICSGCRGCAHREPGSRGDARGGLYPSSSAT